MAAASSKARRAVRAITTAMAAPMALALATSLQWGRARWVVRWLDDAFFRVLSGFPAAQTYAGEAVRLTNHAVMDALWTIGFFGMLLVPLAFMVRLVARARVRAGLGDPIDRARAWIAAHRIATPALLALPGVLGAFGFIAEYAWIDGQAWTVVLPFALFPIALPALAARAWLRGLLAPTLDGDDPATMTIAPDEIVFHAVAVTRETKLAIVAVGAPALPLAVWLAMLPLAELYRNVHVFGAFLAYAIFAGLSATAFAGASRVAVGIDGVRVYGTSRTRFFAYRDFDGARLEGASLVLVKKDRVVLELQLHGADAARRDAVLARVVDNVAKARDRRAVAVHRAVEGRSAEDVARIAAGSSDYRAAAITRDQLWQLVEGATTDATSRTRAAAALATSIEPSDRARLRVAAAQCADPKVRVAIAAIADEVEGTSPLEAARAAVAP